MSHCYPNMVVHTDLVCPDVDAVLFSSVHVVLVECNNARVTGEGSWYINNTLIIICMKEKEREIEEDIELRVNGGGDEVRVEGVEGVGGGGGCIYTYLLF